MTDAIKRKLQEEINALEHELIHELPKEIKKAAALGDLSENAEYHMAKQRQEFVKARVRQLGKRLADLSMVNMNNIPHDRVGLGSTVKIFDNTKNEEMQYKLVTSEESDVATGKISTTSPIGRALLNKKVGDEVIVVSPHGKRALEILSLSTIHDEVEPEEAGPECSRPGRAPSAAPAESCSTPSSAGWRSPASIPTSSPSWVWWSTLGPPSFSVPPTPPTRSACSSTPVWSLSSPAFSISWTARSPAPPTASPASAPSSTR